MYRQIKEIPTNKGENSYQLEIPEMRNKQTHLLKPCYEEAWLFCIV